MKSFDGEGGLVLSLSEGSGPPWPKHGKAFRSQASFRTYWKALLEMALMYAVLLVLAHRPHRDLIASWLEDTGRVASCEE